MEGRKRLRVAGLAVLWVLLWLFGTEFIAFGMLGKVVWLAWLAGFVWIVAQTSATRIPRAVHLALWLAIVVAVTLFRAWRIGGGDWSLFSDGVPHLKQPAGEVVEVTLGTFLTGLALGIVGAMEMLSVMLGTWLGGVVREKRTPPRVALLERVIVVVLHVPLAVLLVGAGLALVGGSSTFWWHDSVMLDEVVKHPGHPVAKMFITGVVLCGLAYAHLVSLFAIGTGARAARVVLGVLGVATSVLLLFAPLPLKWEAFVVVWCVAQVAGLWWARPDR